MASATTWTVNHTLFLGLVLAFFGFLGFRRGVNRELLLMIGIGLGILFAAKGGPSLQPQVNRFYKLGRFALQGGLTAENPADVWAGLNDLAPLIDTPEKVELLSLGLFLGVVGLFYALGQAFYAGPHSPWLRLLGLISGGINGFLIAYYLIPIVFPQPVAVIEVRSAQVNATLADTQNWALVAVVFVAVVIALGLYGVAGSRKQR